RQERFSAPGYRGYPLAELPLARCTERCLDPAGSKTKGVLERSKELIETATEKESLPVVSWLYLGVRAPNKSYQGNRPCQGPIILVLGENDRAPIRDIL